MIDWKQLLTAEDGYRRSRRSAAYGVKLPKAAAKITDDLDELLAVRHRTITKGPGARAAGLAMAFKLIEAAQARWRAVNAPHLVVLVRAGARFECGVLVERHDQTAA
jgi:putative transposase